MSEKSPHSDSVPGAQWRRSPSSAILPLSALVKCVPYFFLGSLTPLSTLPHSLSLCHTAALSLSCAFSITQSLSLSLSLSLSRSPSTPHWQGGKGGSSEVASGANCPPPSPAQLVGGSWADLCKRAIQTQTSGLQRFHNLGERRE